MAWLFLPLIGVVRRPGPSLARPVIVGWMRRRRRSTLRRLSCLVHRTIQHHGCAVKAPAGFTALGNHGRTADLRSGQFPQETRMLLLHAG